MIHSLIYLMLASSVFAFPRNRRESNPTSSATVPCPGAPPLPAGAIPGDACNSVPPNKAIPPPPVSSVPPSRRSKKRDGTSNCQKLTLDQYKTSPMKDAIEAIATKNWGGDFEVVVNPPDFPDSPINFCVTTDTVPATFDNPPTCSTTEAPLAGNIGNGTADASVAVNQGITSTHAVSTEKAVSLASATEIGLTLGVPGLEDATVKETVTLTGTFTQGDTQTTALNEQTIETVTAHGTKPGPCNIQLNVTSCEGAATAQVPAFYTGSVWFNYGSTRDGHFKWSLNVDALLPAEQRSDNMTLTDKITSKNSGHFTTDCV